MNVNHPELGLAKRYEFDCSALQQYRAHPLAKIKSTDASGLAQIIDLVAQCFKIPFEFVETILIMEASYPNRSRYMSSMPRDGDQNKRLPDHRYPNPVEYSAQRGQKYHGLANVNRGAQIYIGVTQISFDFWTDVREKAASYGVRLDAKWFDAPLFDQIVAPFIYFNRYKSYYSTTAILTPAMVYALHQQGPNFIRKGLPLGGELGKQSGLTPTVLRAAHFANKGNARPSFI